MTTRERLTELFFLATLVTVTWEKVAWEPVGGKVDLSEIFALCFVVLFVSSRIARRDSLLPGVAARAGLFGVAFLIADLIGFYNLETHEALAEFAKGLGKFVLHFLFLAAGVAYLARHSRAFYWKAVGALTAGLVVNGVYGILQLLAARAGTNLDAVLISPLTGGASRINLYGAINGTPIWRPNALSGDPNHLGVMLCIPLLMLLPVYLRLERGHPWRVRLAAVLAFLFLVQLSTLSRSGLLGLGVGLLVLAIPYRRRFVSRALLVPLAGVAAVLFAVVWSRRDYFGGIVRERLQTGGRSESAHFGVYDFIPQVLHQHPLFGRGLNTFSVYYEFVTGKSNWGPHSFYVAVLIEGGLVGTAVYAGWLLYVFRSLRTFRELGRRSAFARQAIAARMRPLSWGLTAALVATLAANAFYLTMTFFYFYVFLGLALVALPVFQRAVRREEVVRAS